MSKGDTFRADGLTLLSLGARATAQCDDLYREALRLGALLAAEKEGGAAAAGGGDGAATAPSGEECARRFDLQYVT